MNVKEPLTPAFAEGVDRFPALEFVVVPVMLITGVNVGGRPVHCRIETDPDADALNVGGITVLTLTEVLPVAMFPAPTDMFTVGAVLL